MSGLAAEMSIKASNIWFRYGEDLPWIAGETTYGLNSGEISVLVGANGSGKTTLARILAGELHPERGSVVSDDGLSIGYRYQAYQKNLLPWYRASKNLSLLASTSDGQVQEWMNAADYSEWAETRVSLLSGGQRQILSIILVLAQNPGIAILDEPFSAIDPTRVKRYWLLLRQWAQRNLSAVLVITHNIDEAIALGDNVAVIQDLSTGSMKELSVIRSGSPDEVLRSKEGAATREAILEAFYEI